MPPREYLSVHASSQDRALALARAGSPPGTRVVVGTQTAGRGRRGTAWESPSGGLYLSLVLGPPPPDSALLPLAAGAAIADALNGAYALAVRLKWPNDLVLTDRKGRVGKLGGILVDRLAGPGGGACDVVGVGLNVLPLATVEAAETAGDPLVPVALASVLPEAPSLEALEELVVAAVLQAREYFGSPEGRADVLGRCRTLLYGVGRRVRVDGIRAGRLARLADDGALWIDGSNGPVEVRAGRLAVEEEGR